MYSYPIKFEFPMISIGRHVDVKNGDGKFIMRAVDKFISFKDVITFIDGSSKPVYVANGNHDFRFLFEFASDSSGWYVTAPDGRHIFYMDDYYARMEEFKDIQVTSTAPILQSDGRANLAGVLGNVAENFINTSINATMPGRLVYRIMDQPGGRVVGWVVPSRGTGWFDFLPYSTRRQILNFPLASRAYSPSYELKFGDLFGVTVMKLSKQADLLQDKYTLEKFADISDHQEWWVIPALTLVTMLERNRLKKMTD